MMDFSEDDRAAAYRVLCLSPALSGRQKCAAAALVASFDPATGITTLSHSQLARILGGGRHLARRATDHLIAAGLFTRRRRGGGETASEYVPVWSEFREMDAFWRAILQSGGARNGGCEA